MCEYYQKRILVLLVQHSARNLKQGWNTNATSGPNSCSNPTGRAAVRISGTLNDFLTSHLMYSMLQSIPICTEYNQCGRSRYMIYGVRSRISLYCIRRRMLRLRMRVVLLPLMAQRPTPVLVLAKIMLFSFGTETTFCCSNIKLWNILQFDD